MGRAFYTPATVSYMLKQANEEQLAQEPSDSSASDAAGDLKASQSGPANNATRSTNAPCSWYQTRFDPDDKRLPLITERFVGYEQDSDEEESVEEDEEEDTASDGEESVYEATELANASSRMDSTREDEDAEEEVSYAWRASGGAPEDEVESFSPSAGVFHSHTLAFSLPAPGTMSRRSSNNYNVTASTGTAVDTASTSIPLDTNPTI